MWRNAFFISLALLLFSNIYWLFKSIDSGISYTYLTEGYDDIQQANQVLSNVISYIGASHNQKDILYILRKKYPDTFIVEKENIISIDNINFIFKDKVLSEISLNY